jgi:nucleotide-binding universal stress UspA family protein
MKTDRILLPIDLARCPLDALPLVNSLAGRSRVTVILLHVVHLNILAPENRIYTELCQEAEHRLERLAREYVHPLVDTCVRVRLGDPFKEIVAEAREQQVHLIILPTFKCSFWRRFFTPVVAKVAEKLTRNAPCPVYAMRANTPFNCEERWRQREEVPVHADYRPARNDSLVPAIAGQDLNGTLCV